MLINVDKNNRFEGYMVHQWFLFTRTNAARNDISFSRPGVMPAKGVIESSKKNCEENRSRSISLLSFLSALRHPGVVVNARAKNDNSLIP